MSERAQVLDFPVWAAATGAHRRGKRPGGARFAGVAEGRTELRHSRSQPERKLGVGGIIATEELRVPNSASSARLDAAVVAKAVVSIDALTWVQGSAWWLQSIPAESGRIALLRWRPDQSEPVQVTPSTMDIGTSIHGYGGGAYAVLDNGVAFVNRHDGVVYIQDNGGALQRVTASEPNVQYGDLTWTGGGLWAVRETPAGDEIVILDRAGAAPRPMISSEGFLAAPRVGGSRIAWLQWGNQRMPWDGTELWVADYTDGKVAGVRRIAGAADESVVEPKWNPEGNGLTFVSDRSGWWNLYRWDGRTTSPIAAMPADCAAAPWELGYASYTHLISGRMAATVHDGPQQRLIIVNPAGEVSSLDLPVTSIKPYVAATEDGFAAITASATSLPQIIEVDLRAATASWRPVTHPEAAYAVDPVIPDPLVVNGRAGPLHALVYPPQGSSDAWDAPVIVRAHPGPTASMMARLDGQTQFFCSHGFAVVDVDYRGSTGYSREFRRSLYGQWGAADVEDCTAVARHLLAMGRARPGQVFIMGASAGGYTALQAVSQTDIFAGAIARSAIVDPEQWRRTAPRWQRAHAAELAGPAGAVQAHRIGRPVLFIHGADDDVAPLDDVRNLIATMQTLGRDHELVVLGEAGHEFGALDDNARALTAELRFLRRHLPH
jgi:dipeptidyl aminopeptidase/acylaminoacyl peptidase